MRFYVRQITHATRQTPENESRKAKCDPEFAYDARGVCTAQVRGKAGWPVSLGARKKKTLLRKEGSQMTKQQRGYIFRKGKFWFLRYSDWVLRDGRSVRVQLCRKLAHYSDAYRSEKAVRPLADEILLPINAGTHDVRSTRRYPQFVSSW